MNSDNKEKSMLIYVSLPDRIKVYEDGKSYIDNVDKDGFAKFVKKFDYNYLIIQRLDDPSYQKDFKNQEFHSDKNKVDKIQVVIDVHGFSSENGFPPQIFASSDGLRKLFYELSNSNAKDIEIYFAHCFGSTKAVACGEKNLYNPLDINQMAQNIFRKKGKRVALYYMPEENKSCICFTPSGDIHFVSCKHENAHSYRDGKGVYCIDFYAHSYSKIPTATAKYENGKWSYRTRKVEAQPSVNGIYSKPPRKYIIKDDIISAEFADSLLCGPQTETEQQDTAQSNNNTASISGKHSNKRFNKSK